jgi:hypothetical protein
MAFALFFRIDRLTMVMSMRSASFGQRHLTVEQHVIEVDADAHVSRASDGERLLFV